MGTAPGGAQAERGFGAGAPIDVGAIIEQVHFAFRQRDGAWRGGHTTYEAAVREDGSLELVPFHHPNGRAAAPDGSPAPARAWRDPVDVLRGDPVRFGPSRVARGGASSDGGGSPSMSAGRLEVARGGAVERLQNGAEGVEQSWQFARRPDGSGDLEVRVPLVAGEFAGATEAGLHFAAGALGVRYGHATWIDGLGVETAVPARWDGGTVVLRVPHAVVEGSVYPAVLDPVVSPEQDTDVPVYGPAIDLQDLPALAFDGTNYLVVWRDYRGGTSNDVVGARVRAADGVLLDVGGLSISTAAGPQEYPTVTWDGANYLVVWQDLRAGNWDIYCARVRASDGAVLDPDGRAVASSAAQQNYPVVAWDGTHHLVAWQELRGETLSDIYGVRLGGADAAPADAAAIPISTAANRQESPAVAWDGTNYLIVWQDYRGGGGYDIYGARLRASDGAVLDADGFAISTAANEQKYPAMAWDGADYLVVWQDQRSGTSWDVYGARVRGADRSVLDPGGIVVSAAGGNQEAPDVAWDGAHFLVVWHDDRSTTDFDVYGSRVGADGAVLDAAGFPIGVAANDQAFPALASDGANFLVAWQDYRSGSSWDVAGARVRGSDATVLDPAGIGISGSSNPQRFPAVAWDGTQYLIAWADRRSLTFEDVYACRVSGQDGSLLDPAGIAVSTAPQGQTRPAVAWDGTNFLVAWEDYRSGVSLDVYAARVNGADGAVLDPTGILVSAAAGDQANPAVAWDGANHLVVWEDSRSATTGVDVYGARVRGSDGVVLDAAGIQVSAALERQSRPAVAWDGTNHFVVWQDFRSTSYEDIYGARVRGADGVVLDPAGIPVSTAFRSQFSPAIAWDGTDYLVVWQDRRNSNINDDVYGVIVRGADAAVLDPAFPISTIDPAARSQALPAVAWDGQAFLVAWQDTRNGTLPDLYGARVTAAGLPLDAGGFLVSGAAAPEQDVALASPGPGRFLVVYDAFDPRPSYGITRVKSRTVTFLVPVAGAQAVITSVDVPVTITLTATDGDGDALTYAIATAPAHGTLTGSGASRTYTPAAGWSGTDSFTFTASDGMATSAPATVSVTVTAVNAVPVASGQSVTTAEDTPAAITLTATDGDGDALTYAIATAPAHGTLTGSGASRTYTPAAGWSGTDSFTFTVSDGMATSAPATVSVTVTATTSPPPGDEPGGKGCSCGVGGETTPLAALFLSFFLGRARRRR